MFPTLRKHQYWLTAESVREPQGQGAGGLLCEMQTLPQSPGSGLAHLALLCARCPIPGTCLFRLSRDSPPASWQLEWRSEVSTCPLHRLSHKLVFSCHRLLTFGSSWCFSFLSLPSPHSVCLCGGGSELHVSYAVVQNGVVLLVLTPLLFGGDCNRRGEEHIFAIRNLDIF